MIAEAQIDPPWHRINWRRAKAAVRRLQTRIVKATKTEEHLPQAGPPFPRQRGVAGCFTAPDPSLSRVRGNSHARLLGG